MNIRKILVLILWGLTFTNREVRASVQEDTDTVAIMNSLVKLGNEHVGEKVSLIINELRNRKIPIVFLDYDYTSPFLDKDGKDYLRRITISYKEANLKKWPVLTIYINETNCESEHFEDDMHAYDGDGEERADRIKDLFTIKKVEFDFWPVDYSKKKKKAE